RPRVFSWRVLPKRGDFRSGRAPERDPHTTLAIKSFLLIVREGFAQWAESAWGGIRNELVAWAADNIGVLRGYQARRPESDPTKHAIIYRPSAGEFRTKLRNGFPRFSKSCGENPGF